MSELNKSVRELHSLEDLALGQTVIHRLPSWAKILVTLLFVVTVMLFGRYSFYVLTPFMLYPCVLMALAELPYKLILKRFALALPFCLFAGISNIFFDTHGVLSCLTIILKTYLCVTAVLILVATTPMMQISRTLLRWHVPKLMVSLIELTYRYIGVLLEESASMQTAYLLRSGANVKRLEMRHLGSFLGQLTLRSFDRAERVYAAMKCRGY